MDTYKAKQYHEQMLKFIAQQGNEKAVALNKQAEEEVSKERKQYIEGEKARIVNDFKTKLDQDEVKYKIQISAEDNKVRIERMSTVNGLIQKLYKEAKIKIVSEQSKDINQYKEFLKNLIVQVSLHHLYSLIKLKQGLIKLMEGNVNVRCRQSDLKFVLEVAGKASEEYKALMKSEVKAFKNVDVPLKLNID